MRRTGKRPRLSALTGWSTTTLERFTAFHRITVTRKPWHSVDLKKAGMHSSTNARRLITGLSVGIRISVQSPNRYVFITGSVQYLSHFRSHATTAPWGLSVSNGFIFIYFRVAHRVPAMQRRRAATKCRQDFPSGNAPTTRVRLRISRISRSSGLLVLKLHPVAVGEPVIGQCLMPALF